MRAYRLNENEIAIVLDKLDVEKVLDPDTNNPTQSKETRSMMAWIRAAKDSK